MLLSCIAVKAKTRLLLVTVESIYDLQDKFSGLSSLAVLEGIAISSNPDYKVLGSTYPWIARKVLTDSSPKLQSSLQGLLYKVHHTQSTLGCFSELITFGNLRQLFLVKSGMLISSS